MPTQNHHYDLSFVSAKKRLNSVPEIVFTIAEQHFLELQQRLTRLTMGGEAYAQKYCFDDNISFAVPGVNLFDFTEFGYKECGRFTIEGGHVHLHVGLSLDRVYCSALTIHMLAAALSSPFKNSAPCNRSQQLTLRTLADNHSPHGWGHRVGGYLSESVIVWLQSYARMTLGSSDRRLANLPPVVINAMRETWCALWPKDQHTFAKDCSGFVRVSGHFGLICFGNACDLSLYPEHDTEPGCEFVPIGCHNLDSAPQQLTLLAGLAKLCELARDCS